MDNDQCIMIKHLKLIITIIKNIINICHKQNAINSSEAIDILCYFIINKLFINKIALNCTINFIQSGQISKLTKKSTYTLLKFLNLSKFMITVNMIVLPSKNNCFEHLPFYWCKMYLLSDKDVHCYFCIILLFM